MQAREILIALYLEYLNDYVTIDTFAEHHGLRREEAVALVNVARDVFQKCHPEE
jgi:hypothetical protein